MTEKTAECRGVVTYISLALDEIEAKLDHDVILITQDLRDAVCDPSRKRSR